MKRKRDSKPCRTKKQIPQADEMIEQMGTSILDVPDSVLIDIVLSLPIKAIIMCKCVCKPWRRVISDRHFAKRHFAKAEPCPLIRTIGGSRVSRMLYLIEPSEINVNYDVDSDDEYSSPDCGVNLKLDTKLKIPLRNVELVTQNNTDPKFNSRAGKGGLKKRCVKVTTKEQKFQIVNSCNGFLCLCDPVRNNPLVVCNPITGEYLKLPKTEESNESVKDMVCGLGFSNISNQYKVAEVHTVGTGSWRAIGQVPLSIWTEKKLISVTYVSGSLYWIVDELGKPEVVHSFDFGKEKFGALKLPPYTSSWGWSDQSKMTLGNARSLISDPLFAKDHFARAEPCPLIRTLYGSRVSRTLYLIEPSEIDVSYNVENYSFPESEGGVNLKLDTRLKIPLRNVEMVPQNSTDPKSSSCSHSGSKSGLKRLCVKVTPSKEHKFRVVNSCNGYLCMSHPVCNNPMMVCNPVTGEYLQLPQTHVFNDNSRVWCGLGFSSKRKQYKVLRMFNENQDWPKKIVAQVHTLGTGDWRSIDHGLNSGLEMRCVTYVSGRLYWIRVAELWKDELIMSFDFNNEEFRGIRPPSYTNMWKREDKMYMTLGVLEGRLSFCNSIAWRGEMQIWVLEKSGECTTWNVFKTIFFTMDIGDRWPRGSFFPMNFRKDKGLLMFQFPKCAFFYYSPDRHKWKYLRIRETKKYYEAVAHIPSFIKLKDVVEGDCVEILNVNSRGSEFKLEEETKAMLLVEKLGVFHMDEDCSNIDHPDEAGDL
ncbi:OLC1v1025192C1 [Oldenlandia corymbosa var. corymbosa]|uniref:OLC1v1025192C1 n=1 Tax=Oldenlandia corymbosa var. corymbosa TaxID=529605 RepID=A0AAV1C5W2_OLDCO|nr:OLC1v1025192C1 [Oldenlandia corymbosa var. corymbosa]